MVEDEARPLASKTSRIAIRPSGPAGNLSQVYQVLLLIKSQRDRNASCSCVRCATLESGGVNKSDTLSLESFRGLKDSPAKPSRACTTRRRFHPLSTVIWPRQPATTRVSLWYPFEVNGALLTDLSNSLKKEYELYLMLTLQIGCTSTSEVPLRGPSTEYVRLRDLLRVRDHDTIFSFFRNLVEILHTYTSTRVH